MNTINNLLKTLLLSTLLSATTLIASAQRTFTALEQSSISVPTPGLFTRSNAFNIQFGILKPEEYSFPRWKG